MQPDDFEPLWDWIVTEREWSLRAESCLEAMRVDAKVTP